MTMTQHGLEALRPDPDRLLIDRYDYPLEDARIAVHPPAVRSQCLLLRRGRDGALSTHPFTELPDLLPPDTLLIYNNTRVVNARLKMHRPTGGAVEIFCLEPLMPADYEQAFAATGECLWSCLVGGGKRWKEGTVSMDVTLADGSTLTLLAERLERHTAPDGTATNTVRLSWPGRPDLSFSQVMEAAGEIPIPPYLNRASEASDRTDYQTVYSDPEGSVAAPTAGLHFTDEVLSRIDALGIARRSVTLHVGAGTFRPVKSDSAADHEMHSEMISVERSLIETLARTDKRVVAVGTTSVRTLESLYHLGRMVLRGQEPDTVPQWLPYDSPQEGQPDRSTALEALLRWMDDRGLDRLDAHTRIIIAPGYLFRIVQGMVTNFHQPRSTLLLLVSAFLGQPCRGGDYDSWRTMYDYALAGPYRFLSYGDACLLL